MNALELAPRRAVFLRMLPDLNTTRERQHVTPNVSDSRGMGRRRRVVMFDAYRITSVFAKLGLQRTLLVRWTTCLISARWMRMQSHYATHYRAGACDDSVARTALCWTVTVMPTRASSVLSMSALRKRPLAELPAHLSMNPQRGKVSRPKGVNWPATTRSTVVVGRGPAPRRTHITGASSVPWQKRRASGLGVGGALMRAGIGWSVC
jgi:hypothetical protein